MRITTVQMDVHHNVTYEKTRSSVRTRSPATYIETRVYVSLSRHVAKAMKPIAQNCRVGMNWKTSRITDASLIATPVDSEVMMTAEMSGSEVGVRLPLIPVGHRSEERADLGRSEEAARAGCVLGDPHDIPEDEELANHPHKPWHQWRVRVEPLRPRGGVRHNR
eukprot:scaffold173461_cov28-Tisochrysis_lutea.AAC.1